MAIEKRTIDLEVLKLEAGKIKDLKVVFNTEFGEYPIEVCKEYFDLFIPGKKYSGLFEVSGMPDFIGEKDNFDNICTVSYNLKSVFNQGIEIYSND